MSDEEVDDAIMMFERLMGMFFYIVALIYFGTWLFTGDAIGRTRGLDWIIYWWIGYLLRNKERKELES